MRRNRVLEPAIDVTAGKYRPRRRSPRAGTTMIECVVSAMVLVAVISFVTRLLYRIDGVWKDTGHRRAAMCELSNQLEQLTLLPADDVSAAIESLRPSDTAARTLREPVLTGQLIRDESGPRLVLRIDWQRKHPGIPVEMVAWLPEFDSTDDQRDEAAP